MAGRQAILILAVLAVGCSRWDYTERAANGNTQAVRVDRISGQTQVLSSNAGWVELKPATPPPAPIPSSVPCTAEEIRIANEPMPEGTMLDFERYLPERIKARQKQCRIVTQAVAQ